MICQAFDYDLEAIRNSDVQALAEIDGIGQVIGEAVCG